MYGNGDPLNFTDPTGNFSITELQTVNNIRTNLSSLQIDVGISLLDAYFDPENAATNTGNNAIALGLGAIGGPASFKILRMLSSKFRKACNSFTGDTLVMTENGFVAISDIQIGDVVVAFDEQVNAAVKRSVVHTIEREGEYNLTLIELESGEVIEATNNHPFYVKGDGAQWEWINAEDLRAGQLLKQSDGNELAIDSIASNAWESKVFNLTIEKDHNYFVGDDGVLAHNASPNQCEFLKVGSDANKVRQSLSLYTGRSINLGNQSFRISRGNMKHILERHHPRFWNGTTKSVQTFFDKNMSVIEIETAILAVISQNRAQLTKIGTNAKRGQVTGVYRGKQYKLGIKRGQIGQFYPLEHQ